MSIHFHKVIVKEVKKETQDCVTIEFDLPEELKESFAFMHGQSLTMRTTINNEEVRRTYSICSSPLDKQWKVAVKKVEGGLFSSFANDQIRAGNEIELMQPVGKFYTELDPANKKKYLAFAAGSGITPLLSIIKTTFRSEPLSEFTLVYGNKTRSSIIFFDELEGLKNKYVDRFNLINILSRERTDSPIHSGRINAEKLNELSRLIEYNSFDDIFICGPEEMIFSVKQFLEEKGVDKKKIHFELFTTPGQHVSTYKKPETGTSTGPKSKVVIKVDGRSMEFDLPFSSEVTILDAALKQGADLPFACKGGVCCTCKAKLLEGNVSMDVHWGLEDEEVEQGYILTCQSHPISDKVVVDFDIK